RYFLRCAHDETTTLRDEVPLRRTPSEPPLTMVSMASMPASEPVDFEMKMAAASSCGRALTLASMAWMPASGPVDFEVKMAGISSCGRWRPCTDPGIQGAPDATERGCPMAHTR